MEAESAIDPPVMTRVLLYSVKNDKIGFPDLLLRTEPKPGHFFKEKQFSASFSLAAIAKYSAIEIFKLVVSRYTKKLLYEIAHLPDSKGTTAIEYAEESTNQEFKDLFNAHIDVEGPA